MRRFAVKMSPSRPRCWTPAATGATIRAPSTSPPGAFVAAEPGYPWPSTGTVALRALRERGRAGGPRGAIDLPARGVGRPHRRDQAWGFSSSPPFHGAMKHVAPFRQELRSRTEFNQLGPLPTPLRLRQMMGISTRPSMWTRGQCPAGGSACAMPLWSPGFWTASTRLSLSGPTHWRS